jgi:uncharacterized FlgJ-related protein
MCNEKNNKKEDQVNDYRFLDYRLNQLELKLGEGLKKIEEEQKEYNLQVMETLQRLQEGQNKTYETIAQLEQRTLNLEQRITCIDNLKKAANKNTERNKHLNHRINVIQKILFMVGAAAVSGLGTALFALLMK